MRQYEIMIIVKPTLTEAETKQVIDNFAKVLKDKKAKITEQKELGQKELAYEIKKCKSGYYYLYFVEASDDKAIKEFDRLAKINSNIIRYLITKIEN